MEARLDLRCVVETVGLVCGSILFATGVLGLQNPKAAGMAGR